MVSNGGLRWGERPVLTLCLKAATYIINDDVEAAEEGLNKGNSSFHKVR